MRWSLSPREQEVAEHLATNPLPLAELAETLGITESTLKHHAQMIYHKLEIANRIQLAIYWNCELFKIGMEGLR